TKIKAIATAVMPQVISYFLSTGFYSLELNVRNAAILGYVGAGGIGQLIAEKIGWREYDKFGTVYICLFLLILSIEAITRHVRGKLV
ncbi:MAG: PhnE/PtxC family ABC transporter permease, partial [Lactovum sp.]